MTAAWTFDRKVTLAVVIALALQTGGALVWTGRAVERLEALEDAARSARPAEIKLARLETRLDALGAQLDRIEQRLIRQERP